MCARRYTAVLLYDDRSGKIAIWPYIMRELPLSPVEALRLELRFRGRQRQGSITTATEKAAAEKTAGKRNGVVYYPACLADDNNNVHNNSKNGKLTLNEGEGGLHQQTGPDLKAPISTLDLSTHIVTSRSELPSQSAWRTPGRAAESHASPDRLAYGMGTQSLPLRCDRRRPSSSGARRRARQLPSQASLLDRSAMDDYAECPSGCGEEIRVQDLQEHHKSFCASR